MGVQTPAWENRLVSRAFEALEHHRNSEADPYDLRGEGREPTLEQAYRYCEELTRKHSRTFYLASGLLTEEKRRAVRVLYAFCRISDDMVDRPKGDIQADLSHWQHLALSPQPDTSNPVALAWAETRRRFDIPQRYAEQLIEGVARDLVQTRYETFDDLVSYCYGVASTVGLMCMYIIGFRSPEAIPFAVRLGVALQLTNILRDIGEDWRRGRLYLPLEELERFGLAEIDISSGRLTGKWRSFLDFQISRTRQIYAAAFPGIRLLEPDGRFAITAAAQLYQAILEDIERHDYDVLNRRASVSTWGKLRRLPGIWLKSLS